MNRLSFLLGAGSILAAPAIVRVGSIMPVSVVSTGDGVVLYSMAHPDLRYTCTEYIAGFWVDKRIIERGLLL